MLLLKRTEKDLPPIRCYIYSSGSFPLFDRGCELAYPASCVEFAVKTSRFFLLAFGDVCDLWSFPLNVDEVGTRFRSPFPHLFFLLELLSLTLYLVRFSPPLFRDP